MKNIILSIDREDYEGEQGMESLMILFTNEEIINRLELADNVQFIRIFNDCTIEDIKLKGSWMSRINNASNFNPVSADDIYTIIYEFMNLVRDGEIIWE